VREDGLRDWATLAVAIALGWFALATLGPPDAVGPDAPPWVFSAGRAAVLVGEIAREPHPSGSPGAERVRGVLVKALEDLGLKPEVQSPRAGTATTRNVLARLEGKGSPGKKAILLCAHYDTVPQSPGAGDNASGVAVVLETIRALKAGPPIDRDVIALLDDGEEIGLFGARLFVDEHRWADDVGLVLNFDARGNEGPSFMFETSDGNARLVREYARAVPRPQATSLSMDIYRIMPNDSNLTIFKRAGKAGLNFAISGGQVYYHSPEDTPANLDPRSLQHQGENALATARHFAMLDLEDLRTDDAIYTSILGRFVVAYPKGWAIPLALIAAAAFVVVAAIGVRKRRVRPLDLAAGVAVWGGAAVAAIFATGGFWVVLRDMFLGVGFPWLKVEVPIMTACVVVAATAMLALERRAASRRSVEALGLGALAWWLLGTLATARWLPGASYLFVWPMLSCLTGLGASFLARPGSNPARIAVLLGSIPALVLFPPLMRATFDGLGVRMAAPCMILVVLFLGATLPLLRPILAPRLRA
jgi:hypothetical protein